MVLVVNTLANLFYYLRWFAPVFRGGEPDGGYPEPRAWAARAAVVGGVASVVLALVAGPAWLLVHD